MAPLFSLALSRLAISRFVLSRHSIAHSLRVHMILGFEGDNVTIQRFPIECPIRYASMRAYEGRRDRGRRTGDAVAGISIRVADWCFWMLDDVDKRHSITFSTSWVSQTIIMQKASEPP